MGRFLSDSGVYILSSKTSNTTPGAWKLRTKKCIEKSYTCKDMSEERDRKKERERETYRGRHRDRDRD